MPFQACLLVQQMLWSVPKMGAIFFFTKKHKVIYYSSVNILVLSMFISKLRVLTVHIRTRPMVTKNKFKISSWTWVSHSCNPRSLWGRKRPQKKNFSRILASKTVAQTLLAFFGCCLLDFFCFMSSPFLLFVKFWNATFFSSSLLFTATQWKIFEFGGLFDELRNICLPSRVVLR